MAGSTIAIMLSAFSSTRSAVGGICARTWLVAKITAIRQTPIRQIANEGEILLRLMSSSFTKATRVLRPEVRRFTLACPASARHILRKCRAARLALSLHRPCVTFAVYLAPTLCSVGRVPGFGIVKEPADEN